MGCGDCAHCGKHIASWPEEWSVDVTLYCPECFKMLGARKSKGARR